MFKDAKVGDRVWYQRKGFGTIIAIYPKNLYPIKVHFGNSFLRDFTFDGKVGSKDTNPTLFWDEIKFEIPPKPLPKLEVDTKVLVWNNRARKVKSHFSHFEDGKIMVFGNGTTSWSTNVTSYPFDNWELYDETKELQ